MLSLSTYTYKHIHSHSQMHLQKHSNTQFCSRCHSRELLSHVWIVTVESCSVAQSCLTLGPHGLQHARLPCPLPAPRASSNPCPSSRWCHPTISSSVIPFSSCLQSFPASGSFQMSQFFSSGGQSIGVSPSVSVLPMNIQNWFPLRWTGWISLQSKRLQQESSPTPQFKIERLDFF